MPTMSELTSCPGQGLVQRIFRETLAKDRKVCTDAYGGMGVEKVLLSFACLTVDHR